MLDPEYIQACADALIDECQELQNWIVKNMVRRILVRLSRGDELLLTSSDQWQAQVYEEAGGFLVDLQKQIATFMDISEKEIVRIFQEAAIVSIRADDALMRATGILIESPKAVDNLSPRMKEILSDMYRRTNGDLRNFTRTTALSHQKQLIDNLNSAYFKTITGAQSYTAAVKEAIQNIATQTAEYGRGAARIETVVLRAVRTGVAQAAGAMTIERMHEYGWEYVLVSAHLGARVSDTDPIADHAGWQGKVYHVDYAAASQLNRGRPGKEQPEARPKGAMLGKDGDETILEQRPQYVETIDPSKISEKLKAYEDSIRGLEHERAYAIDKTGRVYVSDGNASRVSLEGVNLKGSVITHNHPTRDGELGGAFGKNDFDVLAMHSGIAQLRVVDGKYLYTATVIKPIDISYSTAYNAAMSYRKSLLDLEDHKHYTFVYLAEKGYIKYERQEY